MFEQRDAHRDTYMQAQTRTWRPGTPGCVDPVITCSQSHTHALPLGMQEAESRQWKQKITKSKCIRIIVRVNSESVGVEKMALKWTGILLPAVWCHSNSGYCEWGCRLLGWDLPGSNWKSKPVRGGGCEGGWEVGGVGVWGVKLLILVSLALMNRDNHWFLVGQWDSSNF